jgi:hypothetical protein
VFPPAAEQRCHEPAGVPLPGERELGSAASLFKMPAEFFFGGRGQRLTGVLKAANNATKSGMAGFPPTERSDFLGA